MKKKLTLLVLLIGLLGFPFIGQAKVLKENKNPQSFSNFNSFEKGNLARKEFLKDPEEEEDENFLYHPLITLPEIGDKVLFAESDSTVTILDQGWLDITDNKLMKATDKFEANKFYEYTQLIQVKQDM